MGGLYGVKETGDVVSLGASTVKAYSNAALDGKFGLEDLVHLVPVGMKIPAAVAGIDLVGKELAELDDEDEKKLHAQVEAELAGEDVPEGVGKHILLIGVHVATALSLMKAHRDKKAAEAAAAAEPPVEPAPAPEPAVPAS